MANIKSAFKKVNSKIWLILGIVLIIVFSVAASKEFIKKHQLDKEIASLQEEIDRLKVEQNEFITLINNYNSESFIEQEARVNFNYKKKGEKVVVIKTDDNNFAPNSDNNSDKELNPNQEEKNKAFGNIVLWWDYFFDQAS